MLSSPGRRHTASMSDVWISRKKWTCKYCDITINDDVPSRTQHESGLRHKSNVERALRDIYKKSERVRKDKAEEAREIKRIEEAAKLSYAKDLAAASSSTTAEPSGPGEGTSASRQPEASTSKEAGAKPEWKPKDPYAAYTSAASLGIEQDPEALRREEDLERRKNEGFAGEWQAVSAVPLSTAGSPPLDGNAGSSSVGQTAYPHSDGDESRNFVLTERVASLDPEDDDGGLAEIRVKKRIRVETRAEMEARAEALRARELPVWTPMRFERGGISNGAKKEESPSAGVGSVKSEVKEENAGVGIKAEIKDQATDPSSLAGEVQTGALKPESPASTAPSTAHARALADSARSSPAAASIESNGGGGGGLFRKRKAGAGAGAKKVRALV